MARKVKIGDKEVTLSPYGLPDRFDGEGNTPTWARVTREMWEQAAREREREFGAAAAAVSALRWKPSAHPRWPKGTPKGGKFMTKGEIATAKKQGGIPQWGSAVEKAKAKERQSKQEKWERLSKGEQMGLLVKGMIERSSQMHERVQNLPGGRDPNDPSAIDCGKDVAKAARLLGEGKAVRLDQPQQVSTLLDKLAEMAQDAKKKGKEAPNYDLCKVMVKGTNLFCAGATLLGRHLMPQLKGDKPRAGSPAAKMMERGEVNRFGEVDLTDTFVAYLKKKGFAFTQDTEHAANLRATQNELNGVKTGNIMRYVKENPEAISGEGPLIVTREGYILDGHHRWAALVGLDAEDGRLGDDKKIPVVRVDIGIAELLYEALAVTIDMGLEPQGFKQGTGGG